MRRLCEATWVSALVFLSACGQQSDRGPAKKDAGAKAGQAEAKPTAESTDSKPVVVIEKKADRPEIVAVETQGSAPNTSSGDPFNPSGGAAPPPKGGQGAPPPIPEVHVKDIPIKISKDVKKIPPPPPLGGRSLTEPTEAFPGAHIVNVLYGTNRRADSSVDTRLRTDEGRRRLPYFYTGDPDRLQVGVVEISVPFNRKTGEDPKGGQVGKSDPGKFFLLMTITPDSTRFETTLEKEAEKSDGDAIVFIHGYNVPFADAVFRAAQIKVDLGFNGPMLAYSWPSKGMAVWYPDDEIQAESTATRDAMFEFLRLAAKSAKVKRIHVVAHSMGNRPTQRALAKLSTDPAAAKIGEIIFAAPDVNTKSEWFMQEVAPKFKQMGARRTLYSSPMDLALIGSALFHLGKRRLGEDFREAEGLAELHSIDASVADTSLLGHSYYGSSPNVLTDVKGVLKGLSPDDRQLVLVDRNRNQWTFKIAESWLPPTYVYFVVIGVFVVGYWLGRRKRRA